MQTSSLLPSVAGLLAAAALIAPATPAFGIDTDGIFEFRSINGADNNPIYRNSGRADSLLIRIAAPQYGDGTDLPRGVPSENEGDGDIEANEQKLPSAREISNKVHDQGPGYRPSKRQLNQLFFQFGQFLSHDTGLSEPDASIPTGGATGLSGNESFNIPISASDPDFTFSEISLTRTVSAAASSTTTGVREQINKITAYIDASNVYGSDLTRANALRTFRGGKLKDRSGPDGALLPLNSFGLENANPLHLPESSLFAAGDVRANEQVGLTAFHTLFMREHNRLADEIATSEFGGSNLSNGFVDQQIYERARAVVGALMQKITYYEWLPAILGYDRLPPYRGYFPEVDPQISNEFSSAAFRIGHTMLPSTYRLLSRNGTETPLALQNAFFNPSFISSNGIDEILRGQSANLQQEIDRFIVDDVRNFLFGPGFGGLDLASLNIQRGRDHGIPSYNRLRRAYGLPGLGSFAQVSRNDATVVALRSAYGSGNVSDIDAWTGGLSEIHLKGTNFGETFTEIFVDQFTRLRDGDRFYFENPNMFSASFTRGIFATSLGDVIRRNSGLNKDDINEYVFFRPKYHPFQPDLRMGKKRNAAKHRGDNRYNNSGRNQRIGMKARSRRSVRFYSSLENDGAFVNRLRLSASLRSQHSFTARVFEVTGGTRRNKTGRLFTGRCYTTDAPGDTHNFVSVVRISKRQGARRKNTLFKLRAESRDDRSADDTVTARLRM